MKKNKFASFLGFIWGLFIVFFIFITYTIFTEESYCRHLDYFAEEIETGHYCKLADNVVYNRINAGSKDDYEEYETVYALGDYFNAAALYKTYSECGDIQRADFYKKKMEEAASKTDYLNFAVEDINTKLETK